MIDKTKISEIAANLKVAGQTAFVGAMPKGDCTLLAIATEPKSVGDDGAIWYPVTFKGSDGEKYDLSLKGLLQANGLKYSTRDLEERMTKWFALLDQGEKAKVRQFTYNGKVEKSVTWKKNWKDFNGVEHRKGETGKIESHSFAQKLVG